jgi:hypothetical protein
MTDPPILAHIANLEKEIADLKATVNKPKERWRPQVRGGQIFLVDPAKCTPDAQEYRGLFYNDIRDANDAHVDILNYMRMRKFAHERNQGWEPDWNDFNQPKFLVWFTVGKSFWQVNSTFIGYSPTEIYFKNKSDAQELVDLLNNELF